MANDDEWENFRGSHEPAEHWELRKEFLARNKDRFLDDKVRLLCLSQAFANMEFLGCKYPTETMELVAELSRGIVEDYREKKSGRLQRTFVKASDAAEKKTKGNKCPSDQKYIYSSASESTKASITSSCVTNSYQFSETKIDNNGHDIISFASASSASSSNHTNNTNSSDISLRLQLLLQNTLSRENDTTPAVSTSVKANNTSHSNSNATKQQQQRFVAASEIERGWLEMEESTKKIKLNTMLPSENDLREVLQTFDRAITVRNPRALLNDIKDLYIVVNQNFEAVSTLIHSLQASHKENYHKFNVVQGVQIAQDGSILTKCEFDFGKGNLIVRGAGKTQKDAKKDVCTKSLQFLQQLCPTLQVKETILAKRKVERSELITDQPDNEPAVIDNPVVMKMMLKMGFKGGGLGLRENGISQAIDVTAFRGRSGLGQEGKSSDIAQFRKNLTKFLNGEARHYGEFDIEFASDFTQAERKIIHEAATISGCYKSKSHGKGEKRFLVLSRKIDLEKLVQQVLERGGETEKYKVTLPNCCTAS